MGRVAFSTIAYHIFSKTRNTKMSPLRSSGRRSSRPASGAPALCPSAAGAPEGGGTTGIALVSLFQFHEGHDQLPELHPENHFGDSRSWAPRAVTICPR